MSIVVIILIFNVWIFFKLNCTGLANPKTVAIKPAGSKDEMAVVTYLTKEKKVNKPVRSVRKTVMKKNLVKMAKSVKSQVLFLILISKMPFTKYWHKYLLWNLCVLLVRILLLFCLFSRTWCASYSFLILNANFWERCITREKICVPEIWFYSYLWV